MAGDFGRDFAAPNLHVAREFERNARAAVAADRDLHAANFQAVARQYELLFGWDGDYQRHGEPPFERAVPPTGRLNRGRHGVENGRMAAPTLRRVLRRIPAASAGVACIVSVVTFIGHPFGVPAAVAVAAIAACPV